MAAGREWQTQKRQRGKHHLLAEGWLHGELVGAAKWLAVLVQILLHGCHLHRRLGVGLLLGRRIGNPRLDRGAALPFAHPRWRAGHRLHAHRRLHDDREGIPRRGQDHRGSRCPAPAALPRWQLDWLGAGAAHPAMHQGKGPRGLFPHLGQPLRQPRGHGDGAARQQPRAHPHASVWRADQGEDVHVSPLPRWRACGACRQGAEGWHRLPFRRSGRRENMGHAVDPIHAGWPGVDLPRVARPARLHRRRRLSRPVGRGGWQTARRPPWSRTKSLCRVWLRRLQAHHRSGRESRLRRSRRAVDG